MGACLSLVSLAEEEQELKPQKPKVQVALLLDTSNSMDGLIDQAKTQLWKIVNSFAKVEKDAQIPQVEVALFEYGNSKLSITDGYIREVSALTGELDEISRDLFSLKTSGGDEYCGAVIQKALTDLDWDTSSGVYKAIFIAGNEPFTQGSVSVTAMCQKAIQEGVVVNAIYCGKEQQGIKGGWKAGAIAAEGDFLTIDQDQAVVHIEAPQDKIIIKLSTELNKTYIPYGTQGKAKLGNQTEQDANAHVEAKKGASISRALTKNSSIYCNRAWDLVDYCKDPSHDLSKVNSANLPEPLQELSTEELQVHVEKMDQERKGIQAKIDQLNVERIQYLKENQPVSNQADTLDQAVTKAIQKQVVKNGFSIK